MVGSGEIASYYRAALEALRFVEARQATGRRFGGDADARWSSFRGDLTTADRLDLLIRDADAQWPSAFGARSVFAQRAVAEDEAFGAGWSPLDPVDAEELWRSALRSAPAATIRDALERCAAAWELRLTPFEVGAVGAAERLVIAGPSAVTAGIEAFAAGSALDWADQVTVIATPPAHRQLAALSGGLLHATKPSRVLTVADAQLDHAARLLVSPDADPADAAKARELTER